MSERNRARGSWPRRVSRLVVRGSLVAMAGFLGGLCLASRVETPSSEVGTAAPPPTPPSAAASPPAPPVVDRSQRRLAALTPVERSARPRRPRGASSESLMALARRLDMPGGRIEDPCLRAVGTECVETALERFFVALDGVTRGERRARISVFGNSLIASDRIVDIWRDRMTERFGDGGRGFLLVDRMAPYGGRSRTGVGARGLETFNVGQGELGRWPHGLPGIVHISTGAARTKWWTRGASQARLFWLDHEDAPPLRWRIDDGPIHEIAPTGTGRGRSLLIEVPEGAKALRLRAPRAKAVLYGASLENPGPGIIVDTLGVVASDSSRFLIADERLFVEQLGALGPDLVTVMLGGNETKRVAWGKSDLEEVRRDLHRFLDRIQAASPEASCLVVGPIENIQGKGSRMWETRWQLLVVNRLMREVALQEGCGFFDLFEAMGGRGALRRLNARNLLHDDLVHPKGKGLDLPGELIAQALLAAYEGAEVPPPDDHVRARWRELTADLIDEAALGSFVEAARGLRGGSRRQLRVLLVGQDGISEPVVGALRARFGDAGRGLVAVEPGARRVELGDTEGAQTLEVLYEGDKAPLLRDGRRTLPAVDVERGGAPAAQIRRARFAVDHRRGLVVDARGSAVRAWRAEHRYPGLIVDVVGPGAAPVDLLDPGGYDLVVGPASPSDDEQAAAWRAVRAAHADPPCLAWTAAGPGARVDGCENIDVTAALGGVDVLNGEPLVEAGRLTERGARVAVDLIAGALLRGWDATEEGQARVGR